MDFIIANVIENATQASEDMKKGRKITLFPTSESFGNVTNRKEHFGSRGLLGNIIPLITGILSVYLGWQCDTIKEKPLVGKIFLSILYFILGGLHVAVYGIKYVFGARCKPPVKAQSNYTQVNQG